jgi:hypothetical protein
MKKFSLILATIGLLLSFNAVRAQDTNLLKTDLEVFEVQPDTVIIRGFSDIGSLATPEGDITVRCKESIDTATGRRLYGLSVGLQVNQEREVLILDYKELEAFLSGVDYLAKTGTDASALPSFEAHIASKSGLRFIAFSTQHRGIVQHFLQFPDATRIPLMSDQVSQFENLIIQARDSIDAMRNPSPPPNK